MCKSEIAVDDNEKRGQEGHVCQSTVPCPLHEPLFRPVLPVDDVFVMQVCKGQGNIDCEADACVPTKFLCFVLDPL